MGIINYNTAEINQLLGSVSGKESIANKDQAGGYPGLDTTGRTKESTLPIYTPAGTGAAPRSVKSKLTEGITIKDFGAIGDGTLHTVAEWIIPGTLGRFASFAALQVEYPHVTLTTDSIDWAAAQAGANSAVANNKRLEVPDGKYVLNNTLSVSAGNSKFVLEGYGMGVSELKFTMNDYGVTVSFSDRRLSPEIRDLTLKTTVNSSTTAAWIDGPVTSSVITRGPIVERFRVCGDDTVYSGWQSGVSLSRCVNPLVQDGIIESVLSAGSAMGVILTATDGYTQFNTNIYGFDIGVMQAGVASCSNVQICGGEISGGSYGVTLYAGSIGTEISGVTIKTKIAGIGLSNRQQCAVHDNVIHKLDGSTSNWQGVLLTDSAGCHVHDNNFRTEGTTTGDSYGIVITGTGGSDFNQIHDNTFAEFTGTGKAGIVLGTGAGNNNIHDNNADSTLTTCIQVNADADPTNKLHNNFPQSAQVFTANAAAPSVANTTSGRWNTANTAATSVTNFLNGYAMQEITVLVNDAFTTFVNGATLAMKGGVNYAAPSGCLIKFVLDGTLWREASRSI